MSVTAEGLVSAGLTEREAQDVLRLRREQLATEVKVYWMYDCHMFAPLDGTTLDEIIAQASEIQKEDTYGMLCAPILLNADGKEVRRVGAGGGILGGAHAHGRGKDMKYWQDQCAKWKAVCEADADVVRLLEARRTRQRTS